MSAISLIYGTCWMGLAASSDSRQALTTQRSWMTNEPRLRTFKAIVMRIERACRITGVTREEHLRASHCKPWRDSSNEERLDGVIGSRPTCIGPR